MMVHFHLKTLKWKYKEEKNHYLYFLYFLFLFFWNMVSLYSPGCRGTCSVNQAEFTEISLPVFLPSAWIKGVCHHYPLAMFYVFFFYSFTWPTFLLVTSFYSRMYTYWACPLGVFFFFLNFVLGLVRYRSPREMHFHFALYLILLAG